MSELVVAALKVAFLALVWVFILFAANVIRTDMFGREVSTSSPDLVARGKATPQRRRRPPRKAPTVMRVVQGSQTGLTVPLIGTVGIGRTADSTLNIDDDYASTRHATLTRDDQGHWWVADLGSTNGTAVNTRLITQPTRLQAGDTIRIGRTQIKVERS